MQRSPRCRGLSISLRVIAAVLSCHVMRSVYVSSRRRWHAAGHGLRVERRALHLRTRACVWVWHGRHQVGSTAPSICRLDRAAIAPTIRAISIRRSCSPPSPSINIVCMTEINAIRCSRVRFSAAASCRSSGATIGDAIARGRRPFDPTATVLIFTSTRKDRRCCRSEGRLPVALKAQAPIVPVAVSGGTNASRPRHRCRRRRSASASWPIRETAGMEMNDRDT